MNVNTARPSRLSGIAVSEPSLFQGCLTNLVSQLLPK